MFLTRMRSSRVERVRLPLSVRPRGRERSRECSVVPESSGPVLHARDVRGTEARETGCGCVEIAVNPGRLHGKSRSFRCTDAVCRPGRSESCMPCAISVFCSSDEPCEQGGGSWLSCSYRTGSISSFRPANGLSLLSVREAPPHPGVRSQVGRLSLVASHSNAVVEGRAC